MPKHPPHLPKKTTNAVVPTTTLTLSWLLVFLVVSVLVSVTAVFYVGAWIFGETSNQQPLFPQLNRPMVPVEDVLAPQEQRHVQDRLVYVYRNVTTNDTVLADENILGLGTWLTTDGWFVLSGSLAGVPTSSLSLVDHLGNQFTADTVVADPTYNLSYVKAGNANVRFSNATLNWHNVTDRLPVTVMGTQGMQSHGLIETVDVDDVFGWTLRDDAVSGPAFVSGPTYLGQQTTDGLIPNWYITLQLARIFADNPVTALSLPFTGSFAQYIPEADSLRRQTVLEVTTVTSQTTALEVGDLITKVNGRTVSPSLLWHDWYSAGETISLVVERDGAELLLTE